MPRGKPLACRWHGVVGRVASDATEFPLGRLDDRKPSGGVVASALGHDLRKDRTLTIDPDAELAPSSLSPFPVLCSCPFAFHHDRESSVTDDQVDWLLGTHELKVNAQASAVSRQRRVARNFVSTPMRNDPHPPLKRSKYAQSPRSAVFLKVLAVDPAARFFRGTWGNGAQIEGDC